MPLTDENGALGMVAAPGVISTPRQARSKPWEKRAKKLFEERMLNTSHPFPCIFGVDAVRRESLRYCFIPAGAARVPTLAAALRVFSARCRDFGSRTSLVAFFEPDDSLQSLDSYRREFWRLLNGVGTADSEQWPSGIDTDTESSEWEFSCFGTAFFVVANTPLHHTRRSRFFDYFTITFQPRFVFDNLGPDTVSGSNARKIIRSRLGEYDSVAPHPQLGGFGQEGNREWVQYFLPDDNTHVPDSERCPFMMRADQDRRTAVMAEPEITQEMLPGIPPGLLEMVPSQGSFELQHDQPGKIFSWHQHDLNEELFVLSGGLTLFWIAGDGGYRERRCEPGDHIRLPARTVHGSTAGREGAYYIIRPDGGKTAVTSFLAEDQWPYPVVEPG